MRPADIGRLTVGDGKGKRIRTIKVDSGCVYVTTIYGNNQSAVQRLDHDNQCQLVLIHIIGSTQQAVRGTNSKNIVRIHSVVLARDHRCVVDTSNPDIHPSFFSFLLVVLESVMEMVPTLEVGFRLIGDGAVRIGDYRAIGQRHRLPERINNGRRSRLTAVGVVDAVNGHGHPGDFNNRRLVIVIV